MKRRDIDHFHELLRDFSTRKPPVRDDVLLTGFTALAGSSFNGKLMVIGRSVNGWERAWLPSKLTEEECEEIIATCMAVSMRWVQECWGANTTYGYNTKRSAFWRVVRGVTTGLDVPVDTWWDAIVWSNLYKVSFAAGWNPTGALMDFQQQKAEAILVAEIAQWEPQQLLFLTGRNWAAPFIERVFGEVSYEHQAEGIFKVIGQRVARSVVVAPHPMGKAESPIIDAILSALRNP